MSDVTGQGLPKLGKPREEVAQTVGDRIARGEEIRAAPISDEATHEAVQRSFSTWDDWNETYLR